MTKTYKQQLSLINSRYYQAKLRLEKQGAPRQKLEKLSQIRRGMVQKLLDKHSDDLSKLNRGETFTFH